MTKPMPASKKRSNLDCLRCYGEKYEIEK